MKRKLPRMLQALETYLDQTVEKRYVTPEQKKLYEKNRKSIRDSIEQESLKKYIDAASKQNEEYFELKALELLSRDDKVSKASNELLFQQLTVTPQDILQKYPDYKAQAKQPDGGGVAQ